VIMRIHRHRMFRAIPFRWNDVYARFTWYPN